MKWIGQHIYDLIARFRNDVYLEDVQSGTIASGGNLGLDSNNKIVKATETTGDITGVTAGNGLSGGGTSGAVELALDFNELSSVTPTSGDRLATIDSDASTHQLTTLTSLATLLAGSGLTATGAAALGVDVSQPSITTLAGLTGAGATGSSLSIASNSILMEHTDASSPTIQLTNTTDDASGPNIALVNRRFDSSIQPGEDLDFLGTIGFTGYNDATPSLLRYAQIFSLIHDATTGEESGSLYFQVVNHDGELGTGLSMVGGSEEDEIDVNIALGTNSITSIAGDLVVNGGVTGNSVVLSAQSVYFTSAATNEIHFGHTSYGWDSDTISSASVVDASPSSLTLAGNLAHCGIILPFDVKNVEVKGYYRPAQTGGTSPFSGSAATATVNSGDDITTTLRVFSSTRPDANNSNLTLTQRGTGTDTLAAGARNKHFYTCDISAIDHTFSAGELLFLGFEFTNAGDHSFSGNIKFTYTISCQKAS